MNPGCLSRHWLLFFTGWIALAQTAAAQVPLVRFGQLPAVRQLFPRDSANQARVAVGGRVETPGYAGVSLQVFRNDRPFSHQRRPLAYGPDGAGFSLTGTIRAELAEYRFDVYLHGTGGDSVRVARRDSLVCGDVFLVAGQSNAITLPELVREYGQVGEFYRTFGRFTDGDAAPYNPADTLWGLADQTDAQRVGVWAHELQRLIVERYQVPVAVINGGFPGAGIQYLNPNPAMPADPTTPYGRMLYRVQKAGVVGKARAMFWWQGELDAYRSIPDYPLRFDTLYRAWQRDFPALQKIYVAQIAIINDQSDNAGAIRDFQRRLPDLYPNVVAWSSLGTAGFGGLHYSTEGYRRHGQELFRLVARDFYGATDVRNIASPALRKVFFTTPENRDLTLVFDQTQDLTVQADSTLVGKNGAAYTRRLADFVYLDVNSGAVERLTASGNRVQVRLKAPALARRLTYLPPWFKDENAVVNTYDGPHLRNARGMAALSFENVPIAAALAAPVATARAVSSAQIEVSWRTAAPGATELILERSRAATGPFAEIRRFPVAPGAFTDPNLQPATAYFYQLRAVSPTAESLPSATQSTTTLLPAPTLNASAVSFREVRLTWSPPGLGTPRNWVLERSPRADGDFQPVATPDAGATSYADASLQPATTYFYRLKLQTADPNESEWATASATTAVVTGTEPDFAWRAFPNPVGRDPVGRDLTLEWPHPVTGRVRLVDALGGVRLETTVQAQRKTVLTLPPLPPGVYRLHVEADGARAGRNLLVQP